MRIHSIIPDDGLFGPVKRVRIYRIPLKPEKEEERIHMNIFGAVL